MVAFNTRKLVFDKKSFKLTRAEMLGIDVNISIMKINKRIKCFYLKNLRQVWYNTDGPHVTDSHPINHYAVYRAYKDFKNHK